MRMGAHQVRAAADAMRCRGELSADATPGVTAVASSNRRRRRWQNPGWHRRGSSRTQRSSTVLFAETRTRRSHTRKLPRHQLEPDRNAEPERARKTPAVPRRRRVRCGGGPAQRHAYRKDGSSRSRGRPEETVRSKQILKSRIELNKKTASRFDLNLPSIIITTERVRSMRSGPCGVLNGRGNPNDKRQQRRR